MAITIEPNEATAANRRVYFQIVDATDGMTPETGEEGSQPQISTNGGAWTNTGIGTLVAIGNGRYYATLTQAAVATEGDVIESRYKSDNTAEMPGTTVQVQSSPAEVGYGTGSNTVNVTVTAGALASGATVSVSTTATGASIARATCDSSGVATLKLDDGTYYFHAHGVAGYTHDPTASVVNESPEAIAVTMTAFDPAVPEEADAITVVVYARDASGVLVSQEGLIEARLSTPCKDTANLVVEQRVKSTYNVLGYHELVLYRTSALVADDGASRIYWIIKCPNWTFKKVIGAATANGSNVLSLTDYAF